MNKIFFLAFIFSSFLSTLKADYWTQKADFPVPTVFASAFSIGDKGYIGLGAIPSYTTTFWEYDTTANTWTQNANFPGPARAGAMSFAIDSLGYIGCGTTASVQFKDFYEYHPSTNTWVQKADFGGTPRFQGFGFSINGKGYIGTGEYTINNLQVDFWEYDPMLIHGLSKQMRVCSDAIAIWAFPLAAKVIWVADKTLLLISFRIFGNMILLQTHGLKKPTLPEATVMMALDFL
jgi:hypothetical protein